MYTLKLRQFLAAEVEEVLESLSPTYHRNENCSSAVGELMPEAAEVEGQIYTLALSWMKCTSDKCKFCRILGLQFWYSYINKLFQRHYIRNFVF